MTTALFIGRFQPFHKGHLAAIKQILAENESIVIAIGSSQESNTPKNPFTVAERREMLNRTMAAEGVTSYTITEIPDATEDSSWIENAKAAAKFDVVYTSDNPWTRHCFEQTGIPVKQTTFIGPYCSTSIREKIKNNETWQDQVPTPVSDYLIEINAQERIKSL